MYKYIYLGLQNKVINPDIGILHFDWYSRQDEEESSNLPFKRPAVFVEFLSAPLKSLGKSRVQMGKIGFRIHLVSDNKAEARYGSSKQTQALSHTELVNKVNKNLLGKSYKLNQGGKDYMIFNSISRTRIYPDHAKKYIIKTIQEYKCTAYDYSAVVDLIVPDPKPPLSMDLTSSTSL